MADEKEKLEENINLDEDFEDEEEIVTLYNELTKKDEDFYVVWSLEVDDKAYILLTPVEPTEDFADDEVLICEIGENENGEEFVRPVDDDAELQKVYDEYVKEYEEAYKEEN